MLFLFCIDKSWFKITHKLFPEKLNSPYNRYRDTKVLTHDINEPKPALKRKIN